ncbi:MAG: phosphoesterase [Clostridia bacterium]|nr:phosphoesterase [Clostridia bacterium]
MVDIHNHILYGLDDGSRSINETKAMLRAAKAAGVKTLVATPHVRKAPLNPDVVRPRYIRTAEMAEAIGLRFLMGAEVFHAVAMEMDCQTLLHHCIEGTNTLLLEFAYDTLPPNLDRMIIHLQRQGFNLIIAHPERYEVMQRHLSIPKRLVKLGCELQVDAESLNGGLFSRSKKCAKQLLKMNLVHNISSDAHQVSDYKQLKKAMEKYGHMLRHSYFLEELS